MGVLGALGALPADVDVSVGSVLPEARALKGRLESSTLEASECHLKRAALVGLEGLTERRWGG